MDKTEKGKRIFAIIAAFILGAVMVFGGWHELRNSKRLAAEGKATTAQVEDKVTKHGRRGSRSYYLEVQFRTEAGQNIQKRVTVDSSQYDAATLGGTVPLHYLPSEPEVCAAGEKVETKYGMLLIGFGALALGGFLCFAGKTPEQSEAPATETEPQSAEAAPPEDRKAA